MQRTSVVFIAALALVASHADGQRRRAVTPDPAGVAIEFVDVASGDGSLTTAHGDAWLDVGTFFKRDPREKGVHIRRQVGLRLVRPGDAQWGAGRLSAHLQSSDGRTTVRVDGRLLTTTPTIIDSRAAIGPVTVHYLEIVVPDTAPAGAIGASILWEVTTDP